MNRNEVFELAFRYVKANRVRGHYLEFGVGERTFRLAAELRKKLGLDAMELWGLDSFAGLPPGWPGELTHINDFEPGRYRVAFEHGSL